MLRRASLVVFLLVAGCVDTSGTLVRLTKARIDTPQSEPSKTDAASADGAARAGSVPATAWQIQLSGTVDTSVNVPWYEVDAVDTDASAITALHARGRTVSCYISVGTDEAWRSDSADFPAAAVGNALADYSRERWVDVRDDTVRAINQRRIQTAAERGCDAVDLSNVEAHTVDSGFPLTSADDLAYGIFLLGIAHAAGLSSGVSASADLIASLASEMDWGLTEECLAYDSCDAWRPLVDAGKPVFMIEYGSAVDAPSLCPRAAALGFSLVIKRSSLDAFRVGCEATDGGS